MQPSEGLVLWYCQECGAGRHLQPTQLLASYSDARGRLWSGYLCRGCVKHTFASLFGDTSLSCGCAGCAYMRSARHGIADLVLRLIGGSVLAGAGRQQQRGAQQHSSHAEPNVFAQQNGYHAMGRSSSGRLACHAAGQTSGAQLPLTRSASAAGLFAPTQPRSSLMLPPPSRAASISAPSQDRGRMSRDRFSLASISGMHR